MIHILLIGANVNPSSHHDLVCDPRPPCDPAMVDLRPSAAHDAVAALLLAARREQPLRGAETPRRGRDGHGRGRVERRPQTHVYAITDAEAPRFGRWLAEEPAASASRVGGGPPPPVRQPRHEGRPARGDPSGSRRTRDDRSSTSRPRRRVRARRGAVSRADPRQRLAHHAHGRAGRGHRCAGRRGPRRRSIAGTTRRRRRRLGDERRCVASIDAEEPLSGAT